MTSIVFNVALGKVRTYAELGLANDALVCVPLELTGLDTDDTLRDIDTLAAVLAGATNAQTTVGRKNLANTQITVDDTANEAVITSDALVWTAPSGSDVGAFLIGYDSDTTSGDDTGIIPLVMSRVTWDPSDGVDFTLDLTDGWFSAESVE